ERLYRPEDLWAYRPIRRPPVPSDIIDPSKLHNPIDNFIQARLKQKGISRLADPADRRTLRRRAAFDLTGLPAEGGAFIRLIDERVASPHSGEQQAGDWLDVARYADTSGFANDFERPAAWRYRDYVIRRFNADVPYDRFIAEQLAGDELDPEDPE